MKPDMNAPDRAQRLAALAQMLRSVPGRARDANQPEYVNNHIHTTYSFSPYSPTMAAYTAWDSGLTTAGIMDHDSVAGAQEFIEASRSIGIGHTVGFECRCLMTGTPFEGRRINNPDQLSVAYLAMHGIPHQNLPQAQAFLSRYRAKRDIRNRAMLEKLNGVVAPCGISLDFARDVMPLSQSADGGTITERHILYALALRLMERYGRGDAMIGALEGGLGLSVGPAPRNKLADVDDPWYAYHLLGLLKAEMVQKFYIDATDECPHVLDFVALAQSLGAVSAYAYLGDVQNSVTGDKKDQAFEDAYLDALVDWLADTGFQAITFMPSRNTPAQLERVMSLCRDKGLFQISGEDINSPFQSFICPQLADPRYRHLIQSTWALIGHEIAATQSQKDGMFSGETIEKMPSLDERIDHFAALGRETYAKED